MFQIYVFLFTEVFAEVLCSGDSSQCLAELEEVPLASLWPRNSSLRVLASLLNANDQRVSKAAADYLSSGASSRHFRMRVRSGEGLTDEEALCFKKLILRKKMFCFPGGGVLHSSSVRGWRSEPESSLLGPQLSAGPSKNHHLVESNSSDF